MTYSKTSRKEIAGKKYFVKKSIENITIKENTYESNISLVLLNRP